MRIRLTVPGEPNAETLGIALEAATRLAQHDVRSGRVPMIEDAIAQGIEWKPEPPGEESFDKPSDVMERGWGDCDDLAPWMAAEMRETGFDPAATAIAIPSGPRTWHAIVRGSDETIYDPSKLAGMPHNVVGTCMPCSRPLNVGNIGIAVNRRAVRVDLPGLQASHGCLIGTAHECACENSDEDRILALIQTIEDAIITAQLARTGDPRSIKKLAVLYRVLRGDDPEEAAADLRVHGVDFSSANVRRFIQKAREILATSADELFNGETWTSRGGRIVKARKVALDELDEQPHTVGFIPCLAALGPIATLGATVGTIAAVLDPIAAALRELAGVDSDFGRAMASLREVLGPIKIASSLSAGVLSLAQSGNIPMAMEATAARWAELLNAPGSPSAMRLAQLGSIAEKAKALSDLGKIFAWTERAIATKLPEIATRLTPILLDGVKTGDYSWAVKQMKEGILKWVREETGFTGVTEQLAEKMAIDALKALSEHSEPLDVGPQASRILRDDPAAWDAMTLQQQLDATRAAFDAMVAAGASQALIDSLQKNIAELERKLSEQVRVMREPEAAPAGATATQSAEIALAEEIREQLRTVPITVELPQGWPTIFAMGCRQLTDECA